MAKYIAGKTLVFCDLWNVLLLTRDKGGRWSYSQNSPQFVKDYLSGYRAPSRQWPHSHSRPLLTVKFAKHLTEVAPELAIQLGVAE